MLEFGGFKVLSELRDLRNDFEIVHDTDTDIIMLSKKTYKHEEENLNFDYKYIIYGFNMYELTGDVQFEDNPFSIEIHLVVAPTSLDKKIKNDIEEYMGGYSDYGDILNYGLSIRMLYDNDKGFPNDNIEDRMFEIANFIDCIDELRGFFLDKYINKIGSTGWDIIWDCINGESFIQRALDRYEVN